MSHNGGAVTLVTPKKYHISGGGIQLSRQQRLPVTAATTRSQPSDVRLTAPNPDRVEFCRRRRRRRLITRFMRAQLTTVAADVAAVSVATDAG